MPVRSALAILATLVTLALGLAGGLALTAGAMNPVLVPGATRHAPWALWPQAGTAAADPYTRALFARRGELAMAPAEGVALYAMQDGQGAALTGTCGYALEGVIPTARVWTLAAYRPDGQLVDNAARRTVLTSAEAVGGGEAMAIAVSREASPGNWLPLGEIGTFVLVLRLYDTPLTAVTAALDATRLPRIIRGQCTP